jgi:ABC-type taurine transport system ATPase subunit
MLIRNYLDEALLLQSKVASLKQPESRVIEAVRHFFNRPQHILGGKAKALFDKKATNNFNDLVAIKPSGENDMLSSFLRRHWRHKVGF